MNLHEFSLFNVGDYQELNTSLHFHAHTSNIDSYFILLHQFNLCTADVRLWNALNQVNATLSHSWKREVFTLPSLMQLRVFVIFLISKDLVLPTMQCVSCKSIKWLLSFLDSTDSTFYYSLSHFYAFTTSISCYLA